MRDSVATKHVGFKSEETSVADRNVINIISIVSFFIYLFFVANKHGGWSWRVVVGLEGREEKEEEG